MSNYKLKPKFFFDPNKHDNCPFCSGKNLVNGQIGNQKDIRCADCDKRIWLEPVAK